MPLEDERLRDLITRCLDKDPDRRPTPQQIIADCSADQPHPDWLPAALAARIARREADLTGVLARAARKRGIVRLKVSLAPLIVALALAVVLALTSNRGDSTLDTTPNPSASRTSSSAPAPGATVSQASGASASPSAGSASPAGQAYQAVFRNRAVSLKDHNSVIDLMTGQVVPGGRYWMLGTDSGGDSKGAFELQDATDAYLAGSGPVTPEQCAAVVAHRPVEDTVHFAQVPLGSWFCLRWRLTGDIAVLRLTDTDTGSFGADVSLGYYRHTPASAAPGAVPGPADSHYSLLYAARPLTLPDDDHSYELTGGHIVSSGGAWLLSTDAGGDGKGAFEPQDTTEPYIAGQTPLGPARCTVGWPSSRSRPSTSRRSRRVRGSAYAAASPATSPSSRFWTPTTTTTRPRSRSPRTNPRRVADPDDAAASAPVPVSDRGRPVISNGGCFLARSRRPGLRRPRGGEAGGGVCGLVRADVVAGALGVGGAVDVGGGAPVGVPASREGLAAARW